MPDLPARRRAGPAAARGRCRRQHLPLPWVRLRLTGPAAVASPRRFWGGSSNGGVRARTRHGEVRRFCLLLLWRAPRQQSAPVVEIDQQFSPQPKGVDEQTKGLCSCAKHFSVCFHIMLGVCGAKRSLGRGHCKIQGLNAGALYRSCCKVTKNSASCVQHQRLQPTAKDQETSRGQGHRRRTVQSCVQRKFPSCTTPPRHLWMPAETHRRHTKKKRRRTAVDDVRRPPHPPAPPRFALPSTIYYRTWKEANTLSRRQTTSRNGPRPRRSPSPPPSAAALPRPRRRRRQSSHR